MFEKEFNFKRCNKCGELYLLVCGSCMMDTEEYDFWPSKKTKQIQVEGLHDWQK